MDIYTFKTRFENLLQPPPDHSLVNAEQAWTYFKASLREDLAEEACEELGFSVSIANHFDGKTLRSDESLFQIYFGRLIDAVKGHPWQTAEINFYYRYPMNEELHCLLAELQKQDVETAYCKSEDQNIINQKTAAIFAFADEKRRIWDAVRQLTPSSADFHFWIW